MPSRAPPPDDETLARLRSLLGEVRGRGLPATELAALGEALGGGVTVDLRAAEALGQPLVVLRPDAPAPGSAPCFDALSPREREVAALLAEGLRNKEIAQRLFVSVATVKDHVHKVLDKTGLESRAAVARAWHAR